MPGKLRKLCVFTARGPLTALAVAAGMLLGIVGPTSAQFFNFGGFQERPQPQRGGGGFGGGWFGNDTFEPFQQRAPQPRRQAPAPVREDFSRAPPPEKRDTVPERRVLVLGDAMADWLAYGLEEAYAEHPDMGVIRRHRTVSGLIKYQPKGDPADWAAAAKGILATEKADAIVVMLGLNDRIAIREPAADKSDNKSPDKKSDKDAKAKPDGKPSDTKSAAKPDAAGKPDDKATDFELSPDDAADNSDAPVIAPEKSARSPNGLYEFREERWVELYKKKIDEMIGVLKSKGVPVLWVGLPAIRGVKGTSDTLFLNHLCRRLGRICRRSRPLPAEGSRLRRPDPPAALLRRCVFHQTGRTQARALCRARNHAAARRAFGADCTAERACDARCQCSARSACAAAPRGTNPAAGRLLRQHRSIARRAGNAPCRGRCARRSHAGQGRGADAAPRPRR